MSVLLRTISSFPTGRTTNELFALLDVEFDPRRRTELYAELSALTEAGKISRDRNGRWRSVASFVRKEVAAENPGGREAATAHSSTLLAADATYRSRVQEAIAEPDAMSVGVDPNALLRYYRSALRADPRGAIAQIPDRHGVQWHLISGLGPLTPEDGEQLSISVVLDDLADEFRKALLKREANDQALAVGWPIAVGRKQGAPIIWPVGLVSGEWRREPGHIDIVIDTDDIVPNPDWIKGAARRAGWTEADLREVFTQPEGIGFRRDEFLSRLREAVAGDFKGAVSGKKLKTELDTEAVGIYDIAAIFIPTDNTFTTGAVRDLDAIATWSTERLGRTALAPILGIPHDTAGVAPPVVNVGSLNREQIQSVRLSGTSPLTVVTGPPGTGKSQAIVSMAASVLAAGGSVLVASKNHQALDAVETRLSSMANEAQFLVRTLDPAREIDRSFDDVLTALLQEPSGGGAEVDRVLRSKLTNLCQARLRVLDQLDEQGRLNGVVADLLERIESREIDAREGRTPTETKIASRVGMLRRLLLVLQRILGRSPPAVDHGEADLEAADLPRLMGALAKTREELAAIDIKADPVALTEEIAAVVGAILPRILSNRAALPEEERLELGEEKANLELMQNLRSLPAGIASKVVARRPLWLASVLGAPRRIPLVEGLFDLVIFDEASQCDVASALPLFARAKRAVVVGDDKQLSFISQLGAAHDRNLMQAQGLAVASMGRFAQSKQSLFNVANLTPGTAKVMLRNQYRSAPDIVSYINDQFYGKMLRVAGDEKTLKPPAGQKPGIAWADVKGPTTPMVGNVNVAEVAAITAQVETLLLKQGYTGSIGVIAPFRPQVQALSEAIGAALPADLLSRAEFRVGTVDSFQGQERDLILFSPCLGYASATSALTFVQKDWRRLNVAISRARAVAHVFGDLSFARSGKVRSLQKLAVYATEPRPRVAEGTFDSSWEHAVYHALKAKGLEPIAQYEIAGRRLDFALFGAGDIKLDLEVDGRRWHADMDGKRKLADHWRDQQLKSMGWRVRRFWVDELARNLEECIELVAEDLS
ncbi:hypothetical protein SMB554_16185 [Sinorhizobium meliloti]|nr:hypothetical protein SMB554_16185 [Sinorhizobium meliloti]